MKKIIKTKIAIVFITIFLLSNLFNITHFLKIDGLDNNLTSPSQSSPTDNNWYLTWGGDDMDYGTDVLIDNANNIYLAGTTKSFGSDDSDLCVVKYDPFRNQIWNLTWGGNEGDFGAKLAFDSLGNVFLAGTTQIYKIGVGTRNYVCLIKFNSSGQKEWETIWGGEADNEYCRDIVIDNSDNIYVSGDTASFGAGGFDAFLVKFDKDGTEQWFQTWGGPDGDFCGSMDLDSFDNIYLTGDTGSYGAGSSDLFLIKYGGSGNFLWETLWGASAYDAGEAIVIDSSDNIFIGGSTTSYGSGGWDFCLLKYDTNGNFKWYQTRGGIDTDYCNAIALDSNNNIYLAGETESFSASGRDYYLVQFNIAGIFQWDFLWGGSNSEECYTLKIDKFDNIFMGGYTESYGLGSRDMCLVKFWEEPHIIIINPTSLNNNFGVESPNFEISINNAEFLNNTYYTLNNSQNYYFSGLTGKINQTAWNQLDDGEISLKFFASNLNGTIISDEVVVYKDTEVQLMERRAYAILVGIEDYPDPYSDLYYTIDDVDAIYSQLYNNYGFDDTPIGREYIQVLLDSDATLSDIENAFSYVGNSINPQDIFFFYFSGHGHPSSIPSLSYLCPYDISNQRIYGSDLDSYLDSIVCSEQYIIIDSCGSGGMINDAVAPNRYFMTACEYNEESWETSALHHGVFTYYFLRSFTQAPDSNGDGVTSMEEQFDYTYPRTVSYSTGLGEAHHPQEYDGIAGEAVIDTTIGSLVFTPNGTQLEYSFYLYGHGTITTLEITVCSVAESITVETFDLIPEAPSNTGFGFYSSNITISGINNITSYKIRVVVDWPKNPPGDPKRIQYMFGDSDGDTLTDIFEIDNGLNPLSNDTDSDGLDDCYEFYGVTDPLLNDTDGDGMLDGYEVFNGLDPLIDDSLLDLDGDGLINILEYTLGTSSNNPDTDGDSMDDGYEYEYGLDLFSDDAGLDLDGDGLNNLLECQLGSYPNNNDSDSDSMPDKWEYDNDLNLIVADAYEDPDGDGLTNVEEYSSNTNPHLEDTDGDTWSDGDEILQGTDPLDPDDYPRSPNAISGYFLFSLLVLIFIGIFVYFKKKYFDYRQV